MKTEAQTEAQAETKFKLVSHSHNQKENGYFHGKEGFIKNESASESIEIIPGKAIGRLDLAQATLNACHCHTAAAAAAAAASSKCESKSEISVKLTSRRTSNHNCPVCQDVRQAARFLSKEMLIFRVPSRNCRYSNSNRNRNRSYSHKCNSENNKHHKKQQDHTNGEDTSINSRGSDPEGLMLEVKKCRQLLRINNQKIDHHVNVQAQAHTHDHSHVHSHEDEFKNEDGKANTNTAVYIEHGSLLSILIPFALLRDSDSHPRSGVIEDASASANVSARSSSTSKENGKQNKGKFLKLHFTFYAEAAPTTITTRTIPATPTAPTTSTATIILEETKVQRQTPSPDRTRAQDINRRSQSEGLDLESSLEESSPMLNMPRHFQLEGQAGVDGHANGHADLWVDHADSYEGSSLLTLQESHSNISAYTYFKNDVQLHEQDEDEGKGNKEYSCSLLSSMPQSELQRLSDACCTKSKKDRFKRMLLQMATGAGMVVDDTEEDCHNESNRYDDMNMSMNKRSGVFPKILRFTKVSKKDTIM